MKQRRLRRYYIAARYDRREEMCGYADELRQLGHMVDCRWLLGQLHADAHKVDDPSWHRDDGVPMEAAPFARDDMEDLAAADTIILFSELPESHSKRGGRHVEFGMALAFGLELVVIGPRENVFHCLPRVCRFDTWEEFKGKLQ